MGLLHSALIGGCLLLGPVAAMSQVVNVDSLRRAELNEIDQARSRASAATAIFLDRSRSVTDRLAAAQDLTTIVDTPQVALAIRSALDPAEPAPVRVRAVRLVGYRVAFDTAVAGRLSTLATGRSLPTDLRLEAVTQIARASFTLPSPGLLGTLRAVSDDPDLEVRRTALRTLAGHADQTALNLLAEGLRTPSKALVPPSEAVHLLGVADPAPFYSMLHGVMLQPPDTATRVAAIQLLGGYGPSRQVIARYLQDSSEHASVRSAALGALAAGDPPGFPHVVVPIVANESTPEDLRLRAIKVVELMRTSRDPRVLRRAPDDFDRLMEQLADRSPAPAVREAARTYQARTRSPH